MVVSSFIQNLFCFYCVDTDFEVLRRDLCGDMERDGLSKLKSRGHLMGSLQDHVSPSDAFPGEDPPLR